MQRRALLRITLATGGSLLLGACDDMPASAVAPWQGPTPSVAGTADVRVSALTWAILAPSPHNLQSWRADLRQSDTIELHVDPDRLLPETDPHSRQILIGCGAFLETLCLALAQQKVRADVELFPAGPLMPQELGRRPFARVRCRPDAAVTPDPLFAAVPLRRTNRLPYRPQVPAADAMVALRHAATGVAVAVNTQVEPGAVAEINRLALQGYAVEFGVAATWKESARVMRIGADEVAREPSGLSLLGPRIWWARQLGWVSHDMLADPQGEAPKQALDMMRPLFEGGTPAWLWLHTPGNTAIEQLASGRAWMRVCLRATQLGLAIHPNSQVLQEFAAMQDLLHRTHQLLGVSAPGRVQMLARIGSADAVPPSPRRALAQFLVA